MFVQTFKPEVLALLLGEWSALQRPTWRDLADRIGIDRAVFAMAMNGNLTDANHALEICMMTGIDPSRVLA